MDRQTAYPGQILPETTLLQMAKDSMIGHAKLAAAVLGTSTIANGFAVTPTGPASLQVLCAPGEIYALTAIDATAWSSLAADTTHSVMKQGILLDGLTLNCPAPGTTGQSINYLIEVTYQDLDSSPVLLPYYNSANPSAPFSGLGNNGLTQNTVRKGAAVVQVKAGASATTGSQTTPAPDAGYVGLYVVTVTFGQTTITSSSISQYIGAPLLPAGIVPAIQSNALTYGKDFGTAGVYKVNYSPAISTLTDGMLVEFEVLTANPGACTLTLNGGATSPVIGGAHTALQGGEFVAGGKAEVMWHSTLGSWVLLGCTGGALQVGTATKSQHAMQLGQFAAQAVASGLIKTIKRTAFTSSGTYTPSAGMIFCDAELGGGGGGGGGAVLGSGTSATGGGGGAGGYARRLLTAAQIGASQAVIIGGAGAGGVAGNNFGSTGGTTSLGALLSATGGGGGGGGAASASLQLSGSGGAGGTGSSGDLNTPGGGGFPGFILGSAGGGLSGQGGSSFFGPGGVSAGPAGQGGAGQGKCSGGSGAAVTGTSLAGGAGGGGYLLITEYCTQ